MPNRTNTVTARPPVIVVMGHIDHGKSTLLDHIRNTNIVDTEAGGITQHLSAYEVAHTDKEGRDRTITFLDTPGHEAFQNMRNHGAEVADIAVLIISAEDGVKAQTLEALGCIQRAAIPYIVAINKIDKPNANVEKVKQELLEESILLEGLGGDVPWVAISAKHGTGIDELLELMLLVADLAELSGDPEKDASGVVIEAHRDPKKGISATLIVKNGTLRRGMCVSSGESISPVRIFEDFRGKSIAEATFSSPVRVVGWSALPVIGAPFQSYTTKKDAERNRAKAVTAPANGAVAIASRDRNGEEEIMTMPLILKADAAGTLDAIEHEIEKLKRDDLELRVVHKSVGAISEGDIKLASGNTGALVIGFNVSVDHVAREIADRNDVTVMTFDIIYQLSEWLAETIEKRRPRHEVEEIVGRAKVLKTFSKTKHKQVLGGRMEEGSLAIGKTVRIMRRDTEIGRGTVANLQQNRADAKRIESGEFGAQVNAAIEIASGDILETFVVTTK